jgi:hypothetical protein
MTGRSQFLPGPGLFRAKLFEEIARAAVTAELRASPADFFKGGAVYALYILALANRALEFIRAIWHGDPPSGK